MAFNSLSYLIFLPILWVLFQFCRDRWRWALLLTASFGFYSALLVPWLPVVLALVILITYVAGLKIQCSVTTQGKQLWFWGGGSANLLLLISLKYLPALLAAFNLSPFTDRFLITIGISYYVFQAISYLIDIHLEIVEPERHLGHFAHYLSFFPKLLQGPIERSGDLLPQFKKPYLFDYENARSGMVLFAWGLFKKVVVADRLALFVNTVYDDVHSYTGLPLILAAYFYALQIYFDFSGYTDMALGSARLFNINLTQNFNSPYLATSVTDFWRRWHISFSRWILDYIFKPLQMSWRDWGTTGTAAALMVTFLISGIWHGASLGYMVWGGLHGVYLAASVFYKPWQKKLHKALGVEKTLPLKIWQTLVTFNLVSFAWIFFRANTLSDALYVVQHLFVGLTDFADNVINNLSNLNSGKGIFDPILMGQSRVEFLTIIVITFTLACIELININSGFIKNIHISLRWTLYYVLLTSTMILGIFNNNQFVYFKF